jgi:hypothetical protein
MKKVRLLLLGAVLLSGAVAAVSAEAPIKTAKGGVLDEIQLFVDSLGTPAQVEVFVRPFDAQSADLGTGGKEGKETRQAEAQTIQKQGPQMLADSAVAALQKGGLFKSAAVLAPEAQVGAGALVVEGKFVEVNPGSRAKRYFAGFGAGKSVLEVTGTVKNAEGKTLATFRQRRIGAMGMGGGDSLGKLLSDTRSIGEDVARFLEAWGRGKSLE